MLIRREDERQKFDASGSLGSGLKASVLPRTALWAINGKVFDK
jgi:hypothetical protein